MSDHQQPPLAPNVQQALAMWRDVFGLIVCRNHSRADNAKVQAFWLAMNQLTGLSRPELMEPDSPWIPADKVRPHLALAPNGQPCNSGWSKWVVACDVVAPVDDIGAEVFSAAYSWELRCWHGIGNTKRRVTHWRDDITAPTP